MTSYQRRFSSARRSPSRSRWSRTWVHVGGRNWFFWATCSVSGRVSWTFGSAFGYRFRTPQTTEWTLIASFSHGYLAESNFCHTSLCSLSVHLLFEGSNSSFVVFFHLWRSVGSRDLIDNFVKRHRSKRKPTEGASRLTKRDSVRQCSLPFHVRSLSRVQTEHPIFWFFVVHSSTPGNTNHHHFFYFECPKKCNMPYSKWAAVLELLPTISIDLL